MFVCYCRDSRGSLEPKHYFRPHVNDDCLPILDVWMNLNTSMYIHERAIKKKSWLYLITFFKVYLF